MSAEISTSGKNEKNLLREEKVLTLRRQYISEKLRNVGKITEEDVRGWLERNGKRREFSLKVLRRDIDFINDYEHRQIFEKKNSQTKNLEWVDDSRKLGATREERRSHNEIPKGQIAELLCSVVLGFEMFKAPQSVENSIRVIRHLTSIKKVLKFSRDNKSRPDLQDKLEAFWADGERKLFLDSGTTAEAFANEYLRYFQMPVHGLKEEKSVEISKEQCVNKIEAITNDRHMFFYLGEPNVQTKVIIVGGRIQFRSSAISGMMAERFLESNDIRAGMSIIGTVAIGLNPNSKPQIPYCYAENEHIASMKRAFLKRSNIRIVIADMSKFYSQGAQADTRICCLHKQEIDLVITNKCIDDGGKNRHEIVRVIEDLGVPVIDYETIVQMTKDS